MCYASFTIIFVNTMLNLGAKIQNYFEFVVLIEKVFVYLWCEADCYEHTQESVCQVIVQMRVFDFAEPAAATY